MQDKTGEIILKYKIIFLVYNIDYEKYLIVYKILNGTSLQNF